MFTDESVLTIHRTQKYQDGVGLADYDSTHDYRIGDLDFIRVYPKADSGFWSSEITDGIFERIQGKSFKEDCTLPREEKDEHPTMLNPVSFLSVEELHSVMTAVPNHTSVLLPAGRKQRQIPTPLNGTITVYPATERRSPERFSSSRCKEKDGIIRWVFSFEAGVVQPYMWLFISVIMHST